MNGMKKIALFGAILTVFGHTAEAKPKLKRDSLAPECNTSMPCEGIGSIFSPFSEARKQVNTNSASGVSSFAHYSGFISGRLICAVNVNAYLASRGIRGTGSALAKSFLRWGRPSGPVTDAVAVFSRGRGGHVAIVDHVEPNGTVIYKNPSARRQKWVVGPYHRRPLQFRVASLS